MLTGVAYKYLNFSMIDKKSYDLICHVTMVTNIKNIVFIY